MKKEKKKLFIIENEIKLPILKKNKILLVFANNYYFMIETTKKNFDQFEKF